MLIGIQARNLKLTEDLRNHIKRRLWFCPGFLRRPYPTRTGMALRHHWQWPAWKRRTNAATSRLIFTHQPGVVIKDTEIDTYFAIDRAADRASRTVARQLTRQRE